MDAGRRFFCLYLGVEACDTGHVLYRTVFASARGSFGRSIPESEKRVRLLNTPNEPTRTQPPVLQPAIQSDRIEDRAQHAAETQDLPS